MGCSSLELPSEYPQPFDIIDKATSIAEMNRPHHGAWYVWGALNKLPSSDLYEQYCDSVRLGFAENQLWDPRLTTEQKVGVFATVLTKEPTAFFADEVANTGKSMLKIRPISGEELEIGQGLLRFAASCFERVVSGFSDDEPLSKRFSVIVEDYARVAALQDEAGSKTDATATANAVAPHLITLNKAGANTLSKYEKQTLYSELRFMALHIGDTDPELLSEILAELPNDLSEKVTKILFDENISKLISTASNEEVDGLLRAFGDDAPSFDFWHELWRLAQNEEEAKNIERATMLIDHVDTVFPKLFDRSDELLLTMTPAELVLFYTGRDDLLARYYKSVIQANNVHMMSRFAGECGHSNDIVRFENMVKMVGLGLAQSRILYEKYFEPNRDEAVE